HLTDPSTGVLNEDLASNQSEQASLNTEISNFQTQLATQTAQLDQMFDAVNASLEEYPYTLAEVNAALGTLSIGSSSTSTTPATSTNTTPTSGTSAASSSSTGSSS